MTYVIFYKGGGEYERHTVPVGVDPKQYAKELGAKLRHLGIDHDCIIEERFFNEAH